MPNISQANKPISLNLDKSRKYLTETEAFYLLNHERYVNVNGTKRVGTIGKTTPIVANYPACEMEQPKGEVYAIGVYRSPITNEVYSFHFSSSAVHYILRVTNAGCEVVYVKQTDDCFMLSAEPQHAIEQWRVYLKVDRTCKNQHGKQLIWCDGTDTPIGQIDVEASIATNYFTTPFFDRCADPCAYVSMCVPKHCGCIHAEPVPLPLSEAGLSNEIIDKSFQFMFKHHYYDGRASEWSDISSAYFIDSKGCFDSEEGLPRCWKLRIPIGNPLVEKIEIAYCVNNSNVWQTTEIVEKYKAYTSAQQYWYERDLSEQITGSNYSDDDCSFDYIFCNNKQCETVDPTQVERVYNPIPREPQGLIPIKDALGFYNYIQGTCPIDKREVDKFDIDLDCQSTINCPVEYVTVTVRAIVHNFLKNRNQFIYRLNGGGEDDTTDTAYFGGLNSAGLDNIFGGGGGFEIGYDQTFNEKTRNFIPYLEGTDSWEDMKQYHSDKNFVNKYQIGVISDMNTGSTRRRWYNDIKDGNFFYQEAKFKVRKGTKGFIRLASHHATNGVGANQNTSTFVIGTINDIHQYRGNSNITGIMNVHRHEIYFEACDGDVELKEIFILRDNAVDAGLQKKASAYHGYIKDKDGRPVEGAVVGNLYTPLAPDFIGAFPSITDHNGFYHFYLSVGVNGSLDLHVLGERDCGSVFNEIKKFNVTSAAGENIQSDQTADYAGYNTNFYCKARIKVADCHGNGVSGIRVALSGSKYRVSRPDGTIEFIIRNYTTRHRALRAVLIDHMGCLTINCIDQCNVCVPISDADAPYCFDGKPILQMPPLAINTDSSAFNKQGLKNGGRYGFGFVVEWACSKITDVNEIKYFDIPKAQDQNGVRFCGFKYDATKSGKMKFPSDATCLKIVRTINLNPYVLQWKVDKIERVSGGNIKLTIQSLNDYNAEYNFKTNTQYGYLKGDRVEFIRNGDGKIFDTVTNGLLNYLTLSPYHDKVISGQNDAPADFFNQLLIEDDGRLTDLTEGAIIEIRRPKACNDNPAYYEICATIPIVNGELLYETGTFKTFDTFLVNRQIGSYSLQFEHHCPSDFWGDVNADFVGISDIGKAHIVNKYANERRYGRNISINATNQMNYFGDFVKTFDAPEQGDIVAMGIKDGKIILAIGEHDNFLAQSADDLIRVGSDGIIRALSADSIISDAQPKISGEYGCQYPHIGSIYFGDGYATWWDVNKNSYIKHDYSKAFSASKNTTDTYFSRRGQEVETFNRHTANPLDKYRIATGLNHLTGALYITVKKLRDDGINNEKAPFLKSNDTIVYHPEDNDWLTFSSPTPEHYSHLDLFDGNGCAMLMYLNGIPYIQPIVPTEFNKFFGVTVDRVVGITLNKHPEKQKIGLSIEVQDDTRWFVSSVTTEDPNFDSEIPAIKWKRNKQKWNSGFLANKNSRGGLFNGQNARGYEISVTFVRDNTDDLKYDTIDVSKRVLYDELDMILFKFMVNEQSGFTENL